MTVQEILNAIIRKYPHSFENQVIIDMINEIQKRLFRTIYKAETATVYDLIADNPFYPIDYSPQSIIDVVVNGKEYKPKNIATSASNRYYYITEDNTIGLYPTPLEDVTSGLTVFRYAEPATLTTTDLSVEPDFDKAWHMMLVYAVCKEIAENALDSDRANGFAAQYNGLENDYYGSIKLQAFQIQEEDRGCSW